MLLLALTVGWLIALGIPLVVEDSASAGADTHVLVVDLGAGHARSVAAGLRRYLAARPARLVVIEPAGSSLTCPLPDPADRSLPVYCPELTRISARLPAGPLVIQSTATAQGASSVSGAAGYTSKLMRSLYGPGVAIAGGPLVFAVTVPGAAAGGSGRAILAALVLAVVAAGLSYWLVRRRSRGRQPVPDSAVREHGDDTAGQAGGAGRADQVADSVSVRNRAATRTVLPPTDFPLVGGPSKVSRLPWGLPRAPSPPAITADVARVGDLDVRAASLVGPSHRAQEFGTSRQDAYLLARDNDCEYLLVAVADGMSDSEHSHVGASVAVNAIIDCLRSALGPQRGHRQLSAPAVFLHAAREIVRHGETSGLSPDAMRTVALAAVIPVQADGSGRRQAWLAVLGDASAWRRKVDGWGRLTGAEKQGLDRNVVAEFLPHHADNAIGYLVPVTAGDVLALVTDGVADAFSEIDGAAAWFAERWRHPPQIGSFFLDVGYEAKTYQDDRTAVIVWCGDDAENETISP